MASDSTTLAMPGTPLPHQQLAGSPTQSAPAAQTEVPQAQSQQAPPLDSGAAGVAAKPDTPTPQPAKPDTPTPDVAAKPDTPTPQPADAKPEQGAAAPSNQPAPTTDSSQPCPGQGQGTQGAGSSGSGSGGTTGAGATASSATIAAGVLQPRTAASKPSVPSVASDKPKSSRS